MKLSASYSIWNVHLVSNALIRALHNRAIQSDRQLWTLHKLQHFEVLDALAKPGPPPPPPPCATLSIQTLQVGAALAFNFRLWRCLVSFFRSRSFHVVHAESPRPSTKSKAQQETNSQHAPQNKCTSVWELRNDASDRTGFRYSRFRAWHGFRFEDMTQI